MADVKSSGPSGAMNKDVRTKLSIQNQSPANKDGMDNERKNKNMNDHNKSNNLMKKRKMNHNGGPQNASGNTNGGGGNNSNNNWNGGPPGNPNQMPYNAHRLTGAPAWDLPPGNSSTQTFTGSFVHDSMMLQFPIYRFSNIF